MFAKSLEVKFKFVVIPILLLILLAITISPSTTVVSAQSKLQWSTPQRIRGMADDSDPPILIADQNRVVHAFNSQWIGSAGRGDLAVFYSQWTPEQGWSSPIDVLLSPYKRQARVLGAFLDKRGTFHVIFFGGVAEDAQIYYSRAPAVDASRASAWSKPQIIGAHAETLASGAIGGDAEGNLFVVYSGSVEGNGLYWIHSADWGNTWSDPQAVFLTNSDKLWVFAIQAALDSKGQFHVVWTVVNKAGNGEAVYYARLDADHKRWNVPLAIETIKVCLYEADWASIMPYKDELFLIYNCGAPAKRWMRRSSDDGRTWTEPVIPFSSLIGENGFLAFALDSNNVLHLIFSNRTSDSRIHGAWHSEWTGNRWTEPDPIVSGPQTSQFDPNRVSATVLQGNILLATWRQDPALVGQVSFSYAMLNAPVLPLVALPTPLPSTTLVSIPTPNVEPSPTHLFSPTRQPTLFPSETVPSARLENNPTIDVLIGILPAVLLLSIYFFKKSIAR